jgi:hypothetical protein
MPLAEELAFIVVAASSSSLLAIMVIVVRGIRREERELTMLRRIPPGPASWVTRQIVGLYVRKTAAEPIPGDDRVPPACLGRRR